MGKVIGVWNLDNPEHCREFIKSCRIDYGLGQGPRPIETLHTEDGKTHRVDEVSDELILVFAQQISEWMERRKK